MWTRPERLPALCIANTQTEKPDVTSPIHRSLTCLTVTMLLGFPALGQESVGRIEIAEDVRSFSPVGESGEAVNLPSYMDSLDPAAVHWYQHVQTLANPWFEGRQPGTRGGRMASEYLSWHFGRFGLQPAFEIDSANDPGLREAHGIEGRTWYQPFEFNPGRSNRRLIDSSVTVRNDVLEDDDYNILGNSGNGTVTGPITFVGYGIEDGPDGYSSFKDDTDLTGRIAVLLRYEPLDEDGRSQWDEDGSFSEFSGISRKLQALVDRGAAGVILVNPRNAAAGRRGLESFRYTRRFRPMLDVPAVHMDQDAADALLRTADRRGRGLDRLQDLANTGRITTVQGRDGVIVTLDNEISRPELKAQNVAGVLPGTGELADEWIVIGGHHDHLGNGYVGSRSNSNEIHYGADDNASGTGAVLVLAERLSRFETDEDRRSIIFIGFDAEEAGLHGSKWFLDNCPVDHDSINCMINLDMMGRLRNNMVSISGTGTAVEFDEILPRYVEPSGLNARATPSGLGPSDHSNFYQRNIPVLFFFTGEHDDYHTPRDHAWLVNPEGAARIIDLAGDLVEEFAVTPKLTFRESTEGGRARRTGAKVRLGIMPSYTADIPTGVLIDGVSDGTSAAEAGLKSGDIILTWDGDTVTDGSTLMQKIMSHEPGDTPVLRIKRGDEEMELPVKLKSSGGS
tara:strand:+ start:14403 stop:16442 length:2040 start_codon:yes stop_codon:yes gene_type:complete